MLTMENKAYLFDVSVGRGILLACSMKLEQHAEHDPLANFMLRRMVQWLAGNPQTPAASITPRRLITAG